VEQTFTFADVVVVVVVVMMVVVVWVVVVLLPVIAGVVVVVVVVTVVVALHSFFSHISKPPWFWRLSQREKPEQFPFFRLRSAQRHEALARHAA